eukprot:g12084.t1
MTNDGPSVAETQADLKAISRKLSSCEAALEGQGSYLGIRDPATLLGQLKTLQKKDEQLREVLLILLRAPPKARPPPPPPAALPAAPSTHPPTRPRPADVACGQHRQQPPSNGSHGTPCHGSSEADTAARRANAGAAAAAAPREAARFAPLPLRSPDSSSGRSPIPTRSGTGSAKTVSLHDALGILPPERAAPRAGAGPRDGSGGSAGGSSSSSSSSPAPSTSLALTYRPGQHALYRLTNSTPDGGGGHSGEGAASRTAKRGGSSSTSSSSSSASSCSWSSAVTTRAQPSSTGGSSTAASPSAGASSASGVGASAPGALPSSSNAEVGESGGGGGGTSSTPKSPAVESREAAAAKANTEMIKEELIEDIEDMVSSTMADGSSRLLMTGVGTAPAMAAARAGVEAAKLRDPTKSIAQNAYKVKEEIHSAVKTVVTSTVSEKPESMYSSATSALSHSFDIQNDGGMKRKAVDRRGRLPPPRPPSRAGSDDFRMVETISIDGTGSDGDDRIPGPSKPSPSQNEVQLLGAVGPPRGTAVAESARRQPAEAPSADEQAGPGDGGGQPGEPPHQRGPASLPAEAIIRDVAPYSEAVEPSVPSAESTVPPSRPARKRRKSAEAGGWRSRYNRNEFESGDALLASSSDDKSEGEEDWTGGGKRRASRHGGGDDADAEDGESDEFVDVGVEEDDDDLGVYGGGDGGRARSSKGVVEPVKKRSPPNAWKRRCADGDCQLGASFGMPGKPARFCSAHKDAGMVNVTHRRCEEPRCERQPSFNFAGMRRTKFCGSHKKSGMINVSSPRCDAGGCTIRPSFGFEGDRRAYLCDAHKKPGMINIRRKPRRSSSSSNSIRSVAEEDNPVTAAAKAWRCAQLAAAASAAGGSGVQWPS